MFVEGKEVSDQPVERLVRRGVAYVPQAENVFPDLTIRENLDMGGYVRKSGVRERIAITPSSGVEMKLWRMLPHG